MENLNQKLENLISKAHFGKVMLGIFIVTTMMSYAMFLILTPNVFNGTRMNYFPLALSILMSFWASGVFWFIRKSDEFYDKAKVLKQKIEETETRKEIEGLLRNDYENLRKEASHYNHTIALKEIASIAKVKLKYVK